MTRFWRIVLAVVVAAVAALVIRGYFVTDFVIRRHVAVTGVEQDDARMAERDTVAALRGGALFIAQDEYMTLAWDEHDPGAPCPMPRTGWQTGSEPIGSKAGWAVNGDYSLLSFDDYPPDRHLAGFEWGSGADGSLGIQRYYWWQRGRRGFPMSYDRWGGWRGGRGSIERLQRRWRRWWRELGNF